MPRKKPGPPPGWLDNVAIGLYESRVAEDKNDGREGVYVSNPNAQALYFRGVYDALRVVRIWINDDHLTEERLTEMLTALEQQAQQQSLQ